MSMSTIGAHRPYPGYTPRTEVNIIGSDLPGDPPMPSWEEVYEDVEKLPELIRNGPSQERLVLVQGDVCSVWDPIPEALVYNRQLCSLFTFAYMAHVNDVPEDLLLPVIWTLKMQLRVLKESPEEVLLAIGYYPKGEFESPEIPNHLMRCNTIAKLAQHFMHPKINRPMEAIQCFKELIELFEKRRQLSDLTPHPEPEVWIANPTLYYYYGEALMHEDLLEARNIFEKSLEGLVACGFSHTSGFPYSFRIHANLALILSKLEIDETARKSHESWVLKFVKRNPDLLSNKDLRETFIRPEFGPHPVLAKLGGEKWLVKQSVAHVRMCINCDAREPDVKLSQCGGCMTIWYCTKFEKLSSGSLESTQTHVHVLPIFRPALQK
ncbi:hypothetical protein AX16_003050 [Volvariella volvacea WC 439]|nr:hypothetical protein AX16_003050 [Volvariella volvacea WC 439]